MYLVSSLFRHGILGLVLVGGMSGCGSSSEGDDVSVVAIAADSRVISVGAGTVLAIDITYDSSRVISGDNFNAVVRLPSELRYRGGSAEVDGFTSEDDNSKSPIVVNCNEGEQYLSFEFSQSDLVRARNPPGNGDMRLNLTIDGVASASNAVIEAAAEEDVPPFACGNVFVADLAESIQVQ